MAKLSELFTQKTNLEIAAAIVLFAIAVYFDALIEVIIYVLYFIIFLEIIRALMSFVTEKRVQTRILINAFIVLSLREFIVNVVKINKENIDSFEKLFQSSTNFNILVFAGVILFLFFLRYLAVITSVDNFPKKDNS